MNENNIFTNWTNEETDEDYSLIAEALGKKGYTTSFENKRQSYFSSDTISGLSVFDGAGNEKFSYTTSPISKNVRLYFNHEGYTYEYETIYGQSHQDVQPKKLAELFGLLLLK